MEGMVSCEMIKISEMLKMKNIRPSAGEASGVRHQSSNNSKTYQNKRQKI